MTRRWVALLRGVNVGGANRLAMADLRAIAGDLGWRDAATYVASGNLMFAAEGRADVLATTLHDALVERLALDVSVIVREGADLKADLVACPYEPEDDRQVHLFFLFGTPSPDHSLLADLKRPDEALTIGERTAWLHTPGGFGRSKLAERVTRVLGCDATGRNLRTVRALVKMLD